MIDEKIIRIAAHACSRTHNRDIERVEKLISMLEVSEQVGSQAIRDFDNNPFNFSDELLTQNLGISLIGTAEILKPASQIMDDVETGKIEVSEELFDVLRDTVGQEDTIREELLQFVRQDMRVLRDNKQKLINIRAIMVIDCVLEEFTQLKQKPV